MASSSVARRVFLELISCGRTSCGWRICSDISLQQQRLLGDTNIRGQRRAGCSAWLGCWAARFGPSVVKIRHDVLACKKVARSVALQQWALSSADSLEKKRPYLHEQPAGLCHPRLDLVGGSANFQREKSVCEEALDVTL